MFRWIGKQLELGRADAWDKGRGDLHEAILRCMRSSMTAVEYKLLIFRLIPNYTKADIDSALTELIHAGRIERDGQVFRLPPLGAI